MPFSFEAISQRMSVPCKCWQLPWFIKHDPEHQSIPKYSKFYKLNIAKYCRAEIGRYKQA